MNRAVLEAPTVTEIANYDQLRTALNKRRVELGMTFEELDGRSGLADHYCAKLLSPAVPARGGYYRNIGPVALECFLGALKVRLKLEPIDD